MQDRGRQRKGHSTLFYKLVVLGMLLCSLVVARSTPTTFQREANEPVDMDKNVLRPATAGTRQARSAVLRHTVDKVNVGRALIVVLKDRAALNHLQLMCQGLHIPGLRHCTLASGACRHVYTHTVIGVTGTFTSAQMQLLRACLPDTVAYVENDGQVFKAEVHGAHDKWWLAAESLQQQQQQPQAQPSKAHAAHDSSAVRHSGGGCAADTAHLAVLHAYKLDGHVDMQQLAYRRLQQATTTSHFTLGGAAVAAAGDQLPNIRNANNFPDTAHPSDGGMDSISSDRRAGLLADIGRAAEVQLTAVAAALAAAAAATSGTQSNQHGNSSDSVVGRSGESEPRVVAAALPAAKPWPPPDIQVVGGPNGGGASAPPTAASVADHQQDDGSPDDLIQVAATIGMPGQKMEAVNLALWSLDRLDQRLPPLDGRYAYGSTTSPGTGQGVTVYTIDSGVRASHQEFLAWEAGAAPRASSGWDFVDDDATADDCDGHGTHVSSTVAGRSVGVAKQANIVAVRVLDCSGSGTISNTVAALDWVAKNARHPAIVTLSLGVSDGVWAQSLESAVKSLVLIHGVTAIVASGNSAVDACTIAPARSPQAITVAASNLANKFAVDSPRVGNETSYKWSNTGTCVSLYAPGVEIYAACGGAGRCAQLNDHAYTWASGTSMAVPHVAGVAALYLEDNPTALPKQVADALLASATLGVIADDPDILPGTPNRLLYSRIPPRAGPGVGNVATKAAGMEPQVEAMQSSSSPVSFLGTTSAGAVTGVAG